MSDVRLTGVAYVAREVLKGVDYLHSQNYVHRDLKSANVMMSIVGEIKISKDSLFISFFCLTCKLTLGCVVTFIPDQDSKHWALHTGCPQKWFCVTHTLQRYAFMKPSVH